MQYYFLRLTGPVFLLIVLLLEYRIHLFQD